MTEQLMEIGQRLYALREIMDISLEDMAGKMNMPAEEYEAYEKGVKDFSFSFLYNVADLLGVDVLDLISGESPKLSRCAVVHKGKGYDIIRRKAYDYKHLAFTFRHKKGEPFLVTVEPKNDEAELEKNAHEGQEFNYILSGAMEFYLGNETYELHEGDSIYFDSGIHHAMKAIGSEPVTFLAIVMK